MTDWKILKPSNATVLIPRGTIVLLLSDWFTITLAFLLFKHTGRIIAIKTTCFVKVFVIKRENSKNKAGNKIKSKTQRESVSWYMVLWKQKETEFKAKTMNSELLHNSSDLYYVVVRIRI